MKDEPEIVKQLRKIEMLGKLPDKIQMVYENPDIQDESHTVIPSKTIGFTKDITEKETIRDILNTQKVNETFWKNPEIYKTVFELSPEAIVIIDKKGTVIDTNGRVYDWIGYTSEEMVGKKILKLPFMPKEAKVKVKKNFFLRMIGIKIPPYELDFITKDGEKRVGRIHATPIRDNNGIIIGDLVIISDITENKKAEDELEESRRMIELHNIQLKKLDQLKFEFLNITSHELRTPMAAIKGYVQMLLRQTLGELNAEQNKALDVVLRNTNRLDRLIRDILDVSQLETGNIKFILNKTNLTELIRDVYETMQPSADLKNIKISVNIEEDIPQLTIDSDRIKQVIVNLLDNAIKFSPDGSTINVRASKKEADVLFEVQDPGRGIPKNKRERIFETFYQVDSGMDRKFGGAGLGLAISRGIVLAHGGNIWVDSKAGEGSTFRFTLPVKPVQDLEGKFKEVDMFRMNNTEKG